MFKKNKIREFLHVLRISIQFNSIQFNLFSQSVK